MNKVFISGSISLKKLPNAVLVSLQRIKDKSLTVLVGDADGIDKQIQSFFKKNDYENVCIYSIYNPPRVLVSEKFQTKTIIVDGDTRKERDRQTLKDEAMTNDSDYNLIIWDGKSKGSYKNIIRALDMNKKIKVFLSQENNFLDTKRINKNDIDFIYYENNGYSAKEIIDYLSSEGKDIFKSTRALNKFLLEEKIIEKQDNIYMPLKNPELFIIEKYRGRVSGIKFNNLFIDWLESKIEMPAQQEGLF